MPYKTIAELPAVFGKLPDGAKTIAMNVINSALDGGAEEESAIKQAWGAVKKSYEQDDKGNWTKLADTLETVDIDGVEILAIGTWRGYPEEKTYKKQDLKDLVKSFNALKGDDKLNYEPPVKLGHDGSQKLLQKDGYPSAGWVASLKAKGEKLVASFKGVPKKIGDIVKAGGYKKVSSEIYHNYEIGGTKYPVVLKAVALLGGDIPAVKTIADIQANYSEEEREHIDTVFYSDGDSLDKQVDKVHKAYNSKYHPRDSVDYGGGWIREVYDSYVIVDSKDAGLEKIPYTMVDGDIEFHKDKAKRVKLVYKVVEGDTELELTGDSLPDEEEPVSQINKSKEVEVKMLKETIKALGLAEETSEEDVLKAITDLKERADKKETATTTLEERVTGLDNQLKEKEADRVVSDALSSGKITPKLKDWAKATAISDPKGFATYVENAPKVVDLEETGGDGADTSDVTLTDDDLKVAKSVGLTEEEVLKEKKAQKEEAS